MDKMNIVVTTQGCFSMSYHLLQEASKSKEKAPKEGLDPCNYWGLRDNM